MKALTVYQPWAQLLAIGAKEYETRGWATKYRGPIAIHAGAMNPFRAIRDLNDEVIFRMKQILRENGQISVHGDFRYLTLGAVIATADLIGCSQIIEDATIRPDALRGVKCECIIQIDNLKLRGKYVPSTTEILFGDWTPGRYAWELSNVVMLPDPIPAKGKQGLWNWDEIGFAS